MNNPINISENIAVGSGQPLLIIAGPCQLESVEHSLMIAEELISLTDKYSFKLVFKSSFDKANRTSASSKRGPGLQQGLEILAEVKNRLGIPVLTDVHLPEQCQPAAEVVDVLQIPAFLCRQTDLLVAAAETGRTINIKKGQFLHPADMEHAAAKIASAGNQQILLCERGASFGYRDLCVDMRSLVIMRDLGYPVVFDATHSVQQIGGASGSSGGNREFIAPLARAATACGIDGLFVECHQDPDNAPSDAASMLPLSKLSELLAQVAKIRTALQERG
jgi:2-dehydro-3-deoxyphosphooctonate aldolase (KDO 8-P synthase)